MPQRACTRVSTKSVISRRVTEVGLYVHVPFCQSRCIYCDFFSTTFTEWREQYVTALQREIRARRDELPDARARTIYIGGGTPSQLSSIQLRDIFEALQANFELEPQAEVTVEANPEDVTADWLAALRDTPVNRISLGVQTFHNDLLRFLHRRHDARRAVKAVEQCLAAGFRNLSIDLIYGLPGQDMTAWRQDVAQAFALDVTHLSAYALMFEEGTALYDMRQKGAVREADEELSLDMYCWLQDEAARRGWEHYEISNFCRPGFFSRHNKSYWLGLPYLGFGPGAHSYDGQRVRRWNYADLKDYVRDAGNPRFESETLSDDELYNEYVMTRLRLPEGVDLTALSTENRTYFLRMAQPHIDGNRLTFSENHVSLSRTGLFVSNDIISDLMR
ncbi:MAG: radical SAM family heme chaperone HemW [Bacteroidaceae bacterium]|nr:radical SAM family heme chaperone HemW [Bacteroidaceae bacterium]